MFIPFFQTLRDHAIPVSLREYLSFLEAMRSDLITYDPEGFYYLARAAMVKDERNLDKFDQAFAKTFEGLDQISFDEMLEKVDLPADWQSTGRPSRMRIVALQSVRSSKPTTKSRKSPQIGFGSDRSCQWRETSLTLMSSALASSLTFHNLR